MKVYFDSSALAKGYLRELSTDHVRELLMSADSVGTCILGFTEVLSALCRHRRESRISNRDYLDTKATLLGDLVDIDILQFSDSVVDRSVQLLEAYVLTGADALHIAAAVEWQADRFVSADKKQLEAARGVGLHCIAV